MPTELTPEERLQFIKDYYAKPENAIVVHPLVQVKSQPEMILDGEVDFNESGAPFLTDIGLSARGLDSSAFVGPPQPTAYQSFSASVSEVYDDVSTSVSSAVDTFIPGAGQFSVAGVVKKGEEMIDGVVSAGTDTINSIKSFFTGDKSGTVASVKEKLIGPAQAELSKFTGVQAGAKDPSTMFVIVRSQQFPGDFVKFDVTPAISESRDASYEEVGIVHHPGQILRYKSSGVRTWGVSARLISRTPEEAAKNLKTLNLVRSWVMPYYGVGTANAKGMQEKLGAPPDVLLFSAYGAKMIPEHPTVMTNYSTSFPNDIDFIETDPAFGPVVPFPVILSLEFALKEAWSPREFSSFDLSQYKLGELKLAFSGKVGAVNKSAALSPGGKGGFGDVGDRLKAASGEASSAVAGLAKSAGLSITPLSGSSPAEALMSVGSKAINGAVQAATGAVVGAAKTAVNNATGGALAKVEGTVAEFDAALAATKKFAENNSFTPKVQEPDPSYNIDAL